MRPDDRDRLVEHFHRLSARSVYFRFFGAKRRLSDQELDQFTKLDFDDRAAVVATLREHGAEHIIGVGRYARAAQNPRSAEVAFAVADEYQGGAVGPGLLRPLLRLA